MARPKAARGAWTAVAGCSALAVAAVAGVPFYDWVVEQSATVSWSAAHRITAVDAAVGGGSLNVVPGASGRVSLTESLTWHSAKPVVTETWVGDVLKIAVSCTPGSGFASVDDCGANLDLTVPAETAVTASSRSGAFAVERMAGPINLRADSGSISLDSVSGPVDAATASGSIFGGDLTGSSFSAKAGSGSVTLGFVEPPRTVNVATGSGSIAMTVPPGSHYLVTAVSGSGTSETDPGLQAPGATATITAHADSGSISVQYQGG